ncbi:DUF4190 domain-containing protein [Microbacterium sp. X-17]|uniref:DUF4190 domain-containing protein n=1 Tax=Microbacterium sp. X-17 TaxID=3144404 RepID=UPI0031F5D794
MSDPTPEDPTQPPAPPTPPAAPEPPAAQPAPPAQPAAPAQPPQYAQPPQQPYGQPQYGQPVPPSPQYPGAYPPPVYTPYPTGPRTNPLAIVSLISSLVGLFIIPIIASIVGVITGHISLSQIKKTGENGHGMALAGVIIGWVSLGLWVIGIIVLIWFFAALASSGVLTYRDYYYNS